MREVLLRLFVEIGHGNTSGEDSVVGMFCRQIGSCLSGKVLCNTISQCEILLMIKTYVKFGRSDTLINTLDDFLCDSRRRSVIVQVSQRGAHSIGLTWFMSKP